jgi:hypothetical protein
MAKDVVPGLSELNLRSRKQKRTLLEKLSVR